MNDIQLKTREGQQISLAEETVNQLKNQLHGALLTKQHPDYETARKVWNGSIDKNPALIICCHGAADVMTAVNFVRDHNLLFSVRAGGHNVSGSAIVESGVVIDISLMRGVQVEPENRLARVEAGARLGDLDHATVPFGLAAPIGVVSETGVAGLTLHGGAGWLMRKHGLSIDNLRAVDIVTADGKLLRASENEHSDLFWALRGGGGNFGVVTNFEFNLHPVGPKIAIAMPIYAMESAREVIAACRNYMVNAPDELMVLGIYWSGPPLPEVSIEHQGKPVVILLGCYTGPQELADKVIAPLKAITKPIADLSADMSWNEVQRMLDEDYPAGKYYYWKSIYLDRLDDKVQGILEEYTLKRPSVDSSIDVWFLGGAVSRIPQTATAFYNRNYPIMIGIEANWSDLEDSRDNVSWARSLHAALQPYSSGGSYLNFPGYVEDQADMLLGVYGGNLTRLRSIKSTYDPHNLFPGLLNILPA